MYEEWFTQSWSVPACPIRVSAEADDGITRGCLHAAVYHLRDGPAQRNTDGTAGEEERAV